MAADLIYAFRVMRLPLLDAGGATIGRIQDIVAVPGRPGALPRVVGFVAESQRRRIFVNANRDRQPGQRRRPAAQLGRRSQPVQPEAGRGADRHRASSTARSTIRPSATSACEPSSRRGVKSWEIAKVRLATRTNLLRRRPSYRLVDVDEVPGVVHAGERGRGRGGPPPRPAPGRGRQHRAGAAVVASPPARRGDGRRAARRRARGAARGRAAAPHRRPRSRPPDRRARRDGVRRPRRPARRDVRRAADPDPRGDGRRGGRRAAPPPRPTRPARPAA